MPYNPKKQADSAPVPTAMDALGPKSESASPASSTRSLDLRRLSVRADSAYSSFSAASVDPEPRTPSPEDSEPYLDWDYVRVVWGGPARSPPAPGPRGCQRPLPPAATLCRPCLPEAQGAPGLLSRQATPLLYALAAEAEAAARTAEPPSPPASRAAYRQRLQGAQRRVLRETSFQRKEFRMSLPARLRPAAPARPSTAHPRSASLSHPLGEAERAHFRAPTRGTTSRGCLASQRREWCLSEPGKLDHMGQGTGPSGACPVEARPSPGLMQPKPQDLQRGSEIEGHQMGWLPGIQRRGTADPDLGSLKLREAYKPVIRSQDTSGEALGHWAGPDGVLPFVQPIPQGAGSPRPLCQTKDSRAKTFLPGQCGIPDSRFLTQEVVAMACPAEGPQDSPADCEQKTCVRSAQLPSLPDDDVFLEEVPLAGIRLHQDAGGPQRLLTSVHASDQHYGTGLNQRAGQAINILESPLHGYPEASGTDSCWQRVNGCVGDPRITCFNPYGTANGDMPTTDPPRLLTSGPPAAAENDPLKPFPANALGPPGIDTPAPPDHTDPAWRTGKFSSRPTWSSQHLEELVQELAKLDPSLSDAFAPRPSPEPPLDVLEGLIPLAEVWSAMGPACGEAEKGASGPTEPGSCLLSSAQIPVTSQEETKPENSIKHPISDQLYEQKPPEPANSLQAKKVELADLLQKMLQDLQTEQEWLRAEAQTCASHKVALESAVDQACTPQEVERFNRFMADLERVMGLLLLLGSRLVRVRCALTRAGLNGDPDEQASLLQRLRLLQQQQEDAKELKEHVARRERALREVLVQKLPAKELRSYRSLLAAKAAVLAQQRSLDERVRLLQDQLDAIRNDLGLCFLPSRPAWPPGT